MPIILPVNVIPQVHKGLFLITSHFPIVTNPCKYWHAGQYKVISKYLIVWGHDQSTWGSGRRNNSHFFQRGSLCMTAVLISWVTSSISMVIALLLLLVLLNWLNRKIKFNSEGEHNTHKPENVVVALKQEAANYTLILTLSPLSSGSSSVKNSRFG